MVSSRYLVSRPDYPFVVEPRPGGPTPFEVFAWYHTLIAAKVYRALVARAAAVRGDADRAEDALGRRALMAMVEGDEDARLDDMTAQLRRLGHELARFPEARAFVRPGLDTPAHREHGS